MADTEVTGGDVAAPAPEVSGGAEGQAPSAPQEAPAPAAAVEAPTPAAAAESSATAEPEASGAVAAEGDATPGAKEAEEKPAAPEGPSTETKSKTGRFPFFRKPSMTGKEKTGGDVATSAPGGSGDGAEQAPPAPEAAAAGDAGAAATPEPSEQKKPVMRMFSKRFFRKPSMPEAEATGGDAAAPATEGSGGAEAPAPAEPAEAPAPTEPAEAGDQKGAEEPGAAEEPAPETKSKKRFFGFLRKPSMPETDVAGGEEAAPAPGGSDKGEGQAPQASAGAPEPASVEAGEAGGSASAGGQQKVGEPVAVSEEPPTETKPKRRLFPVLFKKTNPPEAEATGGGVAESAPQPPADAPEAVPAGSGGAEAGQAAPPEEHASHSKKPFTMRIKNLLRKPSMPDTEPQPAAEKPVPAEP